MSQSATDPVVSLSEVTFHYPDRPGQLPALEKISLEVPPNDFLGLIGPNGGGKTTLLRLILGILKPSRGKVRVLGRPPREVSHRIGYVPQHAKIDAEVPATVLDVVLTGRLGTSPWGFRYNRERVEEARGALDQAGVVDLADRPIGTLSGGQRQRVLIARALASNARILCLDEPMSGVDTLMEQGILELLHGLNKKMPIILVSHDLGFVSAHVKRVGCLDRRLAVHRPEEIGRDVIAEMYHAHGSVLPVHHKDSCPVSRDRPETK